MKRLVPKSKLKKVEFFKTRVATWAQDPEAIGLGAEQVESLADRTEEARVALAAQYAAQQAAQAATLRLKNALEAMSREGAALISAIRVRAATTKDDGVYARAGIPRPAKAAPLGAPGTPYDFSATLRPGGSIALRWKCKHPRGAVQTVYHVSRSIGVDGPPRFLGAAGEREFVDDTLPAGASRIVYHIQAVRTTRVGEIAQFIVSIGGTDRPAPKLATYSTARPKRFRRRAA